MFKKLINLLTLFIIITAFTGSNSEIAQVYVEKEEIKELFSTARTH